MVRSALLVAICGLLIAFLCLVKDFTDFGVSLSSLVLTGFFGYLRHDDNDDTDKYGRKIHQLFNEETIIVMVTGLLCLIAFKSTNTNLFLATSTIFSSAIGGFFGVSVQSKK